MKDGKKIIGLGGGGGLIIDIDFNTAEQKPLTHSPVHSPDPNSVFFFSKAKYHKQTAGGDGL
jgi:hypothetical protein